MISGSLTKEESLVSDPSESSRRRWLALPVPMTALRRTLVRCLFVSMVTSGETAGHNWGTTQSWSQTVFSASKELG